MNDHITFTSGSTVWSVPPAGEVVVPTLCGACHNNCGILVHVVDGAIASIIGMMDLTKAAQTVSQRELRPFEMYFFIAVVYWICTYSMSCFSRKLETGR